eukprot:CAMPEP_0170197364 /NCGR_PEP_ID=MMETSP0040_2-20121228/66236_1 /TAXON_ID=641309 /ORGANISM="Lotharella oceanica, Strain CCMP622" /LENGTH=311 /DNA_ID=CAMNT_0010447019 /DNA_START=66 /DNA_END=997 /DNA_ORIENTATION=+
MGRKFGGELELDIEEALFLMERGCLEVVRKTTGLPLSILEARELLVLEPSSSPSHGDPSKMLSCRVLHNPERSYAAYAHLRRIGFIIKRSEKSESNAIAYESKRVGHTTRRTTLVKKQVLARKRKRKKPSASGGSVENKTSPSPSRPTADSREWYKDIESWSAPDDASTTIEAKDCIIDDKGEATRNNIAQLKLKFENMQESQRVLVRSIYDRLQGSVTKRGFPCAESVAKNTNFDEFDVWATKGSSGASNKRDPAERKVLIPDELSPPEDVLKAIGARLYMADETEKETGSITLALGKPSSLRFYRCSVA